MSTEVFTDNSLDIYDTLVSTDNPILSLMLHEYGETEPLTAEEERNITLEIWHGKQAMALLLSGEDVDVNYAHEIIHKGILAKRKLIACNLRLVIHIAKKLCSSPRVMPDIIQAGTVGLAYAVDNFDPTTGHRFNTYAFDCIQGYMLRYNSENGPALRIPANVSQEIKLIARFRREFFNKHQRFPNFNEIAEGIDINPKRLVHVINASRMPVDFDNEAYIYIVYDHISDAMGENLLQRDTLDEYVFQAELQDMINEILSSFNSRDRDILALRYGLVDEYEYTLEQIASMYGLTRQRVHQIEKQLLDALRNSKYQKKLRSYI